MIRAAAPVNPLIQGSNPASIKQTNLATALRIIRRAGPRARRYRASPTFRAAD